MLDGKEKERTKERLKAPKTEVTIQDRARTALWGERGGGTGKENTVGKVGGREKWWVQGGRGMWN